MNIANKSIQEYLKIITIPVGIYILWAIINNIVGAVVLLFVTNESILLITGLGSIGITIIVGVIVSLLAGWRAVKNFNGKISNAAIAGLFTGIICGLIITVINLAFGFVLELMQGTIIEPAYILGYIIGSILAFVINISLGIFFGTILAVAGGFIAQNM